VSDSAEFPVCLSTFHDADEISIMDRCVHANRVWLQFADGEAA